MRPNFATGISFAVSRFEVYLVGLFKDTNKRVTIMPEYIQLA